MTHGLTLTMVSLSPKRTKIVLKSHLRNFTTFVRIHECINIFNVLLTDLLKHFHTSMLKVDDTRIYNIMTDSKK